MFPFNRLFARIQAFITRRELDRDLDQELESHLAMLTEDHVRRGLTPDEARREARVKLGGLAQLREAHRDIRGLPLLDSFLQDAQYAVRTLRKSPGFTAIAVLTLALGIGVNTAVFTAYNAALLRPIEAAEPDRVVQITRNTRDQFFSYPDYAYYRDSSQAFSGLVATAFHVASLTGLARPAQTATTPIAGAAGFQFPQPLAARSERIVAAVVSGNYFEVLGVDAARGRTFLAEEDTAGGQPVALVSYNFWERRFARDPGLLGRSLTLNGISVTVVGITPGEFGGTLPMVPDLWVTMALRSRLAYNADLLQDRNAVCCRVFGRLQKGVPLSQAEAEMNALAGRLQLAFPRAASRPDSQTGRFVLTTASPLGPSEGASRLAMLMLAAVSLVLLIACANVASLLLARSAARQREIAIRLAIGASRGRLIRQLLTENAVMSLLAGAAGVVFSWWSLDILMVQIAASVPGYWGNIALRVTPDVRILAYTLFLAMSAAVACGLAPALEASRPNLSSALKEERGAFGGHLRKATLRDLMVGTQVAVCLLLLITAGLLARTSQRALEIDLGFNARGIVSLDVNLPPGARAVPANVTAIRSQLARQLAELPEIQSVAGADRRPLAGGVRVIAAAPKGGTLDDSATQNALFNRVTTGYFATMGIPILQGRGFTGQESRDGSNFDGSPVIVSEATARRFWPGEDPLGKRFAFGPGRDSTRFAGETHPRSVSSIVIGVAQDVRSVSLDKVDDTCLYLPATPGFSSTIVLRTRGDEGRAVAAVRRAFQATQLDLEAEVSDSRTAYTNQVGFVASRVGAIGSAIIGLLGLFMAAVGIYGTVRFAVTQRTQEIGIRMALGALRGDVLRLVLSEAMRPVVIGLAVGFALAATASRLMSTFLFGLSALDPVAFLGAAAFLTAAALLAGYVPARRATRVDPMIALRYE